METLACLIAYYSLPGYELKRNSVEWEIKFTGIDHPPIKAPTLREVTQTATRYLHFRIR